MKHIFTLIVVLLAALHAAHADETLLRFPHLVRTETWTERWLNDSGEIETRTVTAAIWNDAIQAALDKDNTVHFCRTQGALLPGWPNRSEVRPEAHC